jgi:lipopolysaccharide export system permease protein
MKKILFRKLLLDCLIFFFIALISASIIIWIFQAVSFLDIMVEDGRDYLIYVKYTLLSFPKIVSKILPFALFFSFFYVFSKYELNNELIIFWNFGVQKLELINFFIKFSFLLTLLQLLLTIFIVPETQNISRSLIRTSDVDFFESFVKPKKFNTNVKGLTIYSEEKDSSGNLKKIYLKKDNGNEGFQITIAKNGTFKTINNSKILVLFDGQTINNINNKITNFSFTRSDFILSTYDTDVIIINKIQETSTINHIRCVKNYYNSDLTINTNQRQYIDHNCSLKSLSNIFQELYKRFIIPLYIPLLLSTSLILIIQSKENKIYNKIKILSFLIGLTLIIISETFLRFIGKDIFPNIKIVMIPFIIFLIIYLYFKLTLKTNIEYKKT